MQQILDRLAAFAQGDRTILALRAKAAATRKDWAGVKTIVQGVETNLQANDPLRRLYGEAFLRLGQPELAIAQFTPIVRGQPGNREARRLLGEGLLAAGDAKGAMAALRPLAQGPARSADFAILAKTAQTLGDPAAKQYQARAVRLAAEALGNDLGRGSAAMAASNWAVAAHAYGRILAVTDGHNVMVLNNMAYAQLMMGNVDLALDFASRAVKLAPNNASVLDTAGWAQFKSGKDLAAAKGLLSKATRLAPANATITAHFAEAARANN
jgi:tetratricopeptide (TPR) repeat protein